MKRRAKLGGRGREGGKTREKEDEGAGGREKNVLKIKKEEGGGNERG